MIDIFRQYGDHLYNKGDHDGAIAQYIKTISKLEASYVIRKVKCKPLLYGQLIVLIVLLIFTSSLPQSTDTSLQTPFMKHTIVHGIKGPFANDKVANANKS